MTKTTRRMPVAEAWPLILKRLAGGETLTAITADPAMPHHSTVYAYMDADASRSAEYARARDVQAERMFDEIDEIIDAAPLSHEGIAKARLKVDAVKWKLGKMAPKRFGDRVAVDLRVEDVATEDLVAEARRLIGQAQEGEQ